MHNQAGWKTLEEMKDALNPPAMRVVRFSLHSPVATAAGPEPSQRDQWTTPLCNIKSAGAAPQLMCLLCGFAVEKKSENRTVWSK